MVNFIVRQVGLYWLVQSNNFKTLFTVLSDVAISVHLLIQIKLSVSSGNDFIQFFVIIDLFQTVLVVVIITFFFFAIFEHQLLSDQIFKLHLSLLIARLLVKHTCLNNLVVKILLRQSFGEDTFFHS